MEHRDDLLFVGLVLPVPHPDDEPQDHDRSDDRDDEDRRGSVVFHHVFATRFVRFAITASV